MINALPVESHIPGYQFCGPSTHLEKRLARGDRGINPLNAACREHDIAYSRSKDLTKRHVADKILAKEETDYCERFNFWRERERERESCCHSYLDGYESDKNWYEFENEEEKTDEKTNIPVAKRGGILPILSLLAVFGSLVSSAIRVAKAINDNKAAQCQLKELKRHNRIMEGHGD